MKKQLAILALTLALASTLSAQERKRPAGNPHNNPMMHCLEVVGLNEAQKLQVKSILDAAATNGRALHEQLRTDRAALETLLKATTPDGCAIGNAMLKVGADEAAIKAADAATRAAVENVLTPDQKLKFTGCMDGIKHRPAPPK